MFRATLIVLLTCLPFMVGCGKSGTNTDVVQDADAEALAEYERLTAEGDDVYGEGYEKEIDSE